MGRHNLRDDRKAEPKWPTRYPEDREREQEAKKKHDACRKVRDGLRKL